MGPPCVRQRDAVWKLYCICSDVSTGLVVVPCLRIKLIRGAYFFLLHLPSCWARLDICYVCSLFSFRNATNHYSIWLVFILLPFRPNISAIVFCAYLLWAKGMLHHFSRGHTNRSFDAHAQIGSPDISDSVETVCHMTSAFRWSVPSTEIQESIVKNLRNRLWCGKKKTVHIKSKIHRYWHTCEMFLLAILWASG